MSTPFIVNLYKPKDLTSYDIIRRVKPHFKSLGKIGHFGTLDPFASGVLMLGVAGAQRLNEYIHECLPKTYLAIGILGKETPTGDMTVDFSQEDNSNYLNEVISKFDGAFLQKTFEEKFLGEYWQAPHKYSAAKYEGKALHEWARAGVEIKKDKKRREIYQIEVVEYNFPILKIRATVSSGTYIRTLFSDMAKELGTLGCLQDLIREQVGGCTLDNTQDPSLDVSEMTLLQIDEVLAFKNIYFAEKEAKLYSNGVKLKKERAQKITTEGLDFQYYWVRALDEKILGLALLKDDEISSLVNFTN